jgi:amino acid transporter
MGETERSVRGASPLTMLKRLFVGHPVSSHQESQHRLPKTLALAVFASDALSSSAYATDEILLVLLLAGSGAINVALPVALAVAVVLAIVVTSYRQTVRAYPQGGGAYRVTKENIGKLPGLIAASALLIDYILTVSVSVAAGIAAVGAAFPSTRQHRVGLALAILALIMAANLRGLKESGKIFAIPTYGFMVSMAAMIAIGFVQALTGNATPPPQPAFAATTPLTLFLVLRAFSSGSTALTGIEAISDGVPSFRKPEARNAAVTLLILAVCLSTLFLGITFLAHIYHADPRLIEEGHTVPSQIARAVFGEGPVFYILQTFTALILFLAANTAYADFPRLASILAVDRYLPSVLRNRGDKLAFSNGIVLLSLAAAAVLTYYRADVHHIIPLYVVGVFTSFTLSQTGMVMRWRRIKGDGWRRKAVVNGIGAVTTGVVLVIVGAAKFKKGAWVIMLLIPLFALILLAIRRHYQSVAEELRADRKTERIRSNRMVVLVSQYPGATLKALGYARALGPEELHLLAFRVPESTLRATRRRWKEIGLRIPIEATGHGFNDLREYIEELEPSEQRPVSVVIPEPRDRSPIRQIRMNRLLLQVKRLLLFEPGVVLVSVPFHPGHEPEPQRLQAPGRLSLIVVVSAVHKGTLRALEYARSLNPAELKAVSVVTDPAEAERLAAEWSRWQIDCALEVVDSPYRSIIQPLVREVRELAPSPMDAVGVVIPEFLVTRWWHSFLHNQTALLIKAKLLFEQNVVVVDVPTRLRGNRRRPRAAPVTADVAVPTSETSP